jgi:hypothetical protein
MTILFSEPTFNSPSGRLVFDVYHQGKLIEHFDEQNLIVDSSKQLHAQLLGGNVTNHSVTKIGFGTNGTSPVIANTLLTTPFIKAVDTINYPATNSVGFVFSLSSSENNGMAISEFGLLTTNNTLYARKVRLTTLPKTVDISLSGIWIITF